MRRDGWFSLVALVGLVAACSAGGNQLGPGDDDDGGTAGSGGAGGGLFTTGGSGPGSGGGGPGGCSEEAKLIYVLSDANVLYSFKPDEKLFEMIGPLQCATSMAPNSMAVDRDATAWVNYVQSDGFGDTAGAIYRVSTVDASCEATPAVTLPAGWFRIGMGYATDGAMTAEETLYVTSINQSSGLGRIDDGALVPIGSFGGAFANDNAELTGRGDGRLFGFFVDSPVEVAEIDPATGTVLGATPLGAVQIPNAWAFSFWGGDFYLYTASTGNSRVNRYRPSDGTVDTNFMTDVGFRIVGAGVSTCAPLTPPS